MKYIICTAILVVSTGAMANESEPNCIQKPVDNRSTTVKVFNGITKVVQALDPTIWIARGILAVIPGQYNAPAPKYCDDVEPQAPPEGQPARVDNPATPESQGAAS